jgi:hypothetical protein
VVSEKKLEMWKVYRRRTPSDGNSSELNMVDSKSSRRVSRQRSVNSQTVNSQTIKRHVKYEWYDN